MNEPIAVVALLLLSIVLFYSPITVVPEDSVRHPEDVGGSGTSGMKSLRSSCFITTVVIMVLLTALAFFAFFCFSPWHFFGLGRSPLLPIGYVGTKDSSLYLSVEAAVRDINHSVRRLSPPQASLLLKTIEAAEATDQFRRLYQEEGVRVFLVASEDAFYALQKFRAGATGGDYKDITVVTLTVLDDDEVSLEAVSPNMSLQEEIRGYLALMASNNPTNKTLEVVPVWENEPRSQRVYDILRTEAESSLDSSSLKLTLPVTYEASKYPTSDAMQVVAEMSSRLVMHPNAHIFFLTSSRLREVIDASDMNKDLTKLGRRWYARGLLQGDLEAVESATEFCTKTSLTTLTFMASDASMESLELLRRSMEHKTGSASVYLEALAYSTMYQLHKSFTMAILKQQDLNQVLRKSESSRRQQPPIVASLTFHGQYPAMVPLPMQHWMVANLIYTNNNSVEAVSTHPLRRTELENVMHGSSLAEAAEECPQPKVKFWLHPSVILPRVSMEFNDLGEVPEVMILPATRGISVSLECSLEAAVTVYCVPSKFNHGYLTCRMAPSSSVLESRRSKRSTLSSKYSLSTLLEDVEENVRPIWSGLTPDVFSCVTSIAGCDFCFYYLATYNLSVAPAACVGGCSLSTFGSCSKIITSSLIQTFDLNP